MLYLTINETCERLRLSRWTVYGLIKAGDLEAFKAEGARNAPVRVSEESLTGYIKRRTIVANTTPETKAS